jgi:hypothetical protein
LGGTCRVRGIAHFREKKGSSFDGRPGWVNAQFRESRIFVETQNQTVITVTMFPGTNDDDIYLLTHIRTLNIMKIKYLVLAIALSAVEANADSTLDAAIGGGIGGAAGAAIGNEVGGRDGAIVGGALGGAIGAAVTTKDEPRHTDTHRETYYRSTPVRYEHPGSHFCPPGQAKKGRC